MLNHHSSSFIYSTNSNTRSCYTMSYFIVLVKLLFIYLPFYPCLYRRQSWLFEGAIHEV